MLGGLRGVQGVNVLVGRRGVHGVNSLLSRVPADDVIMSSTPTGDADHTTVYVHCAPPDHRYPH